MADKEIVIHSYSPESEVSGEFLQGMAARMDTSYHKYGRVRDAYPHTLDALKSMEDRLAKYRETGNVEWLMDVANFAMIEYMCPSHPNAHFRATDAEESPGRVSRMAGRTQKDNLKAR